MSIFSRCFFEVGSQTFGQTGCPANEQELLLTHDLP